jgi:hypothetical protein
MNPDRGCDYKSIFAQMAWVLQGFLNGSLKLYFLDDC